MVSAVVALPCAKAVGRVVIEIEDDDRRIQTIVTDILYNKGVR
jgi:hypothetical protein